MDAHTLVLLRHAKSDWSGGHRDVDRPLADRGRRQAPEAGRWLAGNLRALDLALVSPARRARATWELVAAELPTVPTVRVRDELYAATVDELLEVLRAVPEEADRVVLVGHNPGLEDLVEELVGEPVRMTTSAIAVLAVPGRWRDAGREPATMLTAGRPPTAGPRQSL